MSYVVLARKWRPKVFSEVVGQDHIVKSISYSLKSQKTSHAYLFSGTRGVGKTSMARLLAKTLTCQNPIDINPCNKCVSCISIDNDNSLDVIEIDGASHNGVDHIRSLIENINFLPSQGTHKVYIIDEIHMLSKEAFNALLKTLEAPPAHVVFIFATTVPEKILDTILSRCLRYDFRPLTEQKLISHLENIISKENIKVKNSSVLRSLAHEAKGSVRDALTLLEQALTYSGEDHYLDENALESLGIIKSEKLKKMVKAIILGDLNDLKESYYESLDNISNFSNLGNSLLDEFYQVIQNKLSNNEALLNDYSVKDVSLPELYWIYETLAKDFSWAFSSFRPILTVEVLLQKISLRGSFFLQEKESGPLEIQEKKKLVETPLVQPTVREIKPCDWDGFLNYLKEINQPYSLNLVQGNILSEKVFSKEMNLLKVAFNKKSKVFYDFFSSKESKHFLEGALKQYIKDQLLLESEIFIKIDLQLLEEKEEENLQFKSISQIEDEERLKSYEEIKSKILDRPNLKKVIDIFDAKVVAFKVNE